MALPETIEFAFGDTYPIKKLGLKEREMITIASLLTAGGCESQLEVYINREFVILYLLTSSPGSIFSKEQIYDLVWDDRG